MKMELERGFIIMNLLIENNYIPLIYVFKKKHLINSNILLIGSVTRYGMTMTILFFDFYFFIMEGGNRIYR